MLEVGIAFWRQHVIMWPASALLTGNGVAFVLRVPGTQHGDWWSLRGWWIFAGHGRRLAALQVRDPFRGAPHLQPVELRARPVLPLLGAERAEPLDFWWGPMSPWLALALAIIVVGGLAILSRLRLLAIAVGFWVTFAAGSACSPPAGTR